MNKLNKAFVIIFSVLSLCGSGAITTQQVHAQTIDVPKSTTYGPEPTSGFVDDDGKPISIEEYNKGSCPANLAKQAPFFAV
jgi:hypothetical protein